MLFRSVKVYYNAYEVERMEEFIVFKGALEISSYLEHKTDAPYKFECIAILKYCCDTYKDNNSYITEHLERMFPQKDETCALQEPEEEEIAETVISLDEKEEESEEQKEDLPSNDSNSSTLTLFNCPPCLPKEEECYIVECHDSLGISPFDKFYANVRLCVTLLVITWTFLSNALLAMILTICMIMRLPP